MKDFNKNDEVYRHSRVVVVVVVVVVIVIVVIVVPVCPGRRLSRNWDIIYVFSLCYLPSQFLCTCIRPLLNKLSF